MAFINFPLAAGADIQTRLSAFGELKIAYEERYNLVNALPFHAINRGADFAHGDDMQTASTTVGLWQNFVETYYSAFVDRDRFSTFSTNTSLNPTFPTIAALRSKAGINAAGFTRKYWKTRAVLDALFIGPVFNTPHNTPIVNGDVYLGRDGRVKTWTAGAEVDTGPCYAGYTQPDYVSDFGFIETGCDIYDHDMLNDIWKCFKVMIAITDGCGPDSPTSSAGGTFSEPTFAGMKSVSLADYLANAGTGAAPLGWIESQAAYQGSVWGGQLSAKRAQLRNSFSDDYPASAFSATVEFWTLPKKLGYLFGGTPNADEYDDGGRGLTEDNWQLLTTAGPSNVREHSAFCGTDSAHSTPAWPAAGDPAAIWTPTSGTVIYLRGYSSFDQAIVRFDHAGGFDKY